MSADFFNLDLPFEYHPLEVKLAQPDDFLKVRETLTRIGVASRRDNTLFQSCHILHKQGHYFIVHFKDKYLSNIQFTTATNKKLLVKK
jgi:hypothetical protein